jgi:hypothetical protein
MRGIAKGPEPSALIAWKAENADTPQNLVYGGSFPTEAVRKALLQDQFHLCAYTMKRLRTAADCLQEGLSTASSCHIEHILPQSRNVPAETIDYGNMVACFPPAQGGLACEYGAFRKGNYDPSSNPFVSPLVANASAHFDFSLSGHKRGTTEMG